jgi:NarL family two-component system response regulator LiaR
MERLFVVTDNLVMTRRILLVEQTDDLKMTIRILLVEHPPAVRNTLRAHLMREPGFTVVGEADDGPSALSCAQALHPQVIVVDAEMPNLDLAHLVPPLRQCCPSSGIVILSLHDDAVARRLGRTGVVVVGKLDGTDALVAGIRRAATRRQTEDQ